MSKNLTINTDYIKDTIIAEITRILDKLNSSYKLLTSTVYPADLESKEILVKTKEKLYLTIKDLTKLKNQLTTICSKYDIESSLAIDDILGINHFLLNISK